MIKRIVIFTLIAGLALAGCDSPSSGTGTPDDKDDGDNNNEKELPNNEEELPTENNEEKLPTGTTSQSGITMKYQSHNGKARLGAGDIDKTGLLTIGGNIPEGEWNYQVEILKKPDNGPASTGDPEAVLTTDAVDLPEESDGLITLDNPFTVENWNGLSDDTYTLKLTLTKDGSETEVLNLDFKKEQYSIKTWQDLQGMKHKLDGKYEQVNDIEFPAPGKDGFPVEGFEPIGRSKTNSFEGAFNGNHKQITQFFIDRPDTEKVGLFGVTGQESVLSKIALHTVNAGSTVGVRGKFRVGILVGQNMGIIKNSYTSGIVTGNGAVGGLVGRLDGTIDKSLSSGSVSGEESIGGLVGYTFDEAEVDPTIKNSYATGAVSGTKKIGGLVGNLASKTGTVENSYATGKVTGDGDDTNTVGGLVGNLASGTVVNSYWDRETTGQGGKSAGSEDVSGLLTWQMKNKESYSGWIFSDDFWAIDTTGTINNGYPYLSGNPVPPPPDKDDGDKDKDDGDKDDGDNNNEEELPPETTPQSGIIMKYQSHNGKVRLGAGDIDKTGLLTIDNIPEGEWNYQVEILKKPDNGPASTGDPEAVLTTKAVALPEESDGLITLDNPFTVEDWNGLPDDTYTLKLTLTKDGSETEVLNLDFKKEQYSIKTWQDLQGMKHNLVGKYEQVNDIEFPTPGEKGFDQDGFYPIGRSENNSFEGAFNGNHKQITQFFIDRNITKVGLFGYTGTESVLSNIVLHTAAVDRDGVTVGVRGSYTVGTLAGQTAGIVENSHTTGKVAGLKFVGGLVGYLLDGTIENSYATGAVAVHIPPGISSKSSSTFGGLVGYTTRRSTIKNSHATGTVTGKETAGGLVGESEGEITNTYATGDVTSEGNFVGGLIGISSGPITSSYATGDVKAEGDGTRVGGLAGRHRNEKVMNSYATGAVTGKEKVGGLIGSLDSGKVENSYATGAVTGEEKVGGLIGSLDSGTVENSYATGKVTGDADSTEVGGLVGFIKEVDGGTVENSYWNTETSGQITSAAGTGKTTEEMKVKQLYIDSGWLFEPPQIAIWNIDLEKKINNGYPYLLGNPPPQAE